MLRYARHARQAEHIFTKTPVPEELMVLIEGGWYPIEGYRDVAAAKDVPERFRYSLTSETAKFRYQMSRAIEVVDGKPRVLSAKEAHALRAQPAGYVKCALADLLPTLPYYLDEVALVIRERVQQDRAYEEAITDSLKQMFPRPL